jgi:hypothetical protein
MDESEESIPLTATDTEIRELLGLFDAPSFARRGLELEHALERLRGRCRHQRETLLEMVRLRLRQWGTVATGPDDSAETFAAPIAPLWALCDAAPGAWAAQAAPLRRRRAVARDLVASVRRFNRRWAAYLDQLNLAPVNAMVDAYNRYYLLEKECVLGSARLALRYFTPRDRLSREAVSLEFPELPVPELLS